MRWSLIMRVLRPRGRTSKGFLNYLLSPSVCGVCPLGQSRYFSSSLLRINNIPCKRMLSPRIFPPIRHEGRRRFTNFQNGSRFSQSLNLISALRIWKRRRRGSNAVISTLIVLLALLVSWMSFSVPMALFGVVINLLKCCTIFSVISIHQFYDACFTIKSLMGYQMKICLFLMMVLVIASVLG